MHRPKLQQHGRSQGLGTLRQKSRNVQFQLCHRSYQSGIYREWSRVELRFFATAQSSSKFTYKDFTWCLSLFGTAVG
ncbi:hypothetical protein ABJZ09_16520, partial [Vibrio parahaemolyticus]